ncbi:unnamed protein product [Angiostrongylus costaricensis]|uniref:Uncharacterized protein n=1 Tax=Angiostrongylus costaricensis TaxID=334426 RepID=A0A0R3PYL8_ANGCS|nr:unnamed protein product [Angiostrongylus costaricensis]
MNVDFQTTSTKLSSLLLSIVTTVITVATILRSETSCERFHCSSDILPTRIVDPYLRPRPTFNSPCSCLPDWNSMFCNHTQIVSSRLGHILPEMPTICICRKFVDSGSKCQQFITRCFNRGNKKCTCCFNQPDAYCDHLTCKEGEPEFSSSNTSCVCHHNPIDYPYHICNSLYNQNGPDHLEATQERHSLSDDEGHQVSSIDLRKLGTEKTSAFRKTRSARFFSIQTIIFIGSFLLY